MKKNFCSFLLCCMAYGSLGNVAAADESSSLATQEIDVLVHRALDTFKVPGVAIGIVVDGKIVLAKGYGYRNIEKHFPVTENTLFAIGSCTKACTAFMLGQLVDEGKITWDDPVIQHIPEFRLKDQYATLHTTIRDLAAHRTGLARHDILWSNPAFTRSDVIHALPYLEPACGLREKFQYNNLMYTVAGIVIERVTGQTWEEALTSRIFTPLAMLNSNASIDESQRSNDFSMPYEQKSGEVKAIPFRNLHSVAPAGAINSSVSDMLKWIQLQLSDGTFLNKHLLCKETLQETHTIQMHVMDADSEAGIYCFGYGLGWSTGIYKGQYMLRQMGGIDGFCSLVSLLPQHKIGVVVLSNSSSDGSYVVSSLTNSITDKLLGNVGIDWIEKLKKQQENDRAAEPKEAAETSTLHSTPSHALAEYTGLYEHPAYGTVHVKLENNQLFVTYGETTFLLNHKWYDIFQGDRLILSFEYNNSGDICEVSIPFQKGVKPIVFQRKTDT